jgi:hypothetical protein
MYLLVSFPIATLYLPLSRTKLLGAWCTLVHVCSLPLPAQWHFWVWYEQSCTRARTCALLKLVKTP